MTNSTNVLATVENVLEVKQGESISLIGGLKTGKSTVASQVLRNLLLQNKNVLVISDEHSLSYYLTKAFKNADGFIDEVLARNIGELHHGNGSYLANFDKLYNLVELQKIDAVIVDRIDLGLSPENGLLSKVTILGNLTKRVGTFTLNTIQRPSGGYKLGFLEKLDVYSTVYEIESPTHITKLSLS